MLRIERLNSEMRELTNYLISTSLSSRYNALVVGVDVLCVFGVLCVCVCWMNEDMLVNRNCCMCERHAGRSSSVGRALD